MFRACDFSVVRNTTEAAQDEYDYVVVTMKSLPDVFDVSEIIRPGTVLELANHVHE